MGQEKLDIDLSIDFRLLTYPFLCDIQVLKACCPGQFLHVIMSGFTPGTRVMVLWRAFHKGPALITEPGATKWENSLHPN